MIDVLVIGAGAAGLSIAASLKGLGVSVALIDRYGALGGAYARLYPKTRLASPASLTRLDGPIEVVDDEYVTAGQYQSYLERYAEHFSLAPTRATALAVARVGDRWEVALEGDLPSKVAKVIVFATGMVDSPKWPAGYEAYAAEHDWIIHSAAWRGVPEGVRSVGIIGAGTSAVELAEECAAQGARVYISARQGKVKTVPKDLLGQDLHYYLKPLELLPRLLFLRHCAQHPTVPATDLGFRRLVKGGQVQVFKAPGSLDVSRRQMCWGERVEALDLLVCATGFSYKLPKLPDEFMWRGDAPHTDLDGQSSACDGLFFMGFPCTRSVASEYLRGIAADAPKQAAAIKRYLER